MQTLLEHRKIFSYTPLYRAHCKVSKFSGILKLGQAIYTKVSVAIIFANSEYFTYRLIKIINSHAAKFNYYAQDNSYSHLMNHVDELAFTTCSYYYDLLRINHCQGR